MNRAPPPDSQATFGWPFSFALNRLLGAEPWARERLARFAGEKLELRAPLLPALRFVILPGGTLEAGGDEPSVVLNLRAGAVEVAGNAQLGAELMALARGLRWDAEEELSRLVGDVAAHRAMALARGFGAWQADAARRLLETLADYAVEEKRVLVSQTQLAHFAADVVKLREAVERLEKRVGRLG